MDNSSAEQPARPDPWWQELAATWRGLTASRRRGLLAVACATLLAFGSQFAEMPWRSALRGTDSSFYYFWLRSAMVHGDWDFRRDILECNTMPDDFRQLILKDPPTPTGRQANKYGIGWSVLSVPPYLLADGVVATGRGLGVWTLERDGYNPVYQIFIYTWHFLLALASLVLAWRVVTRWCGDREAALLGVVLLWAASPLPFYQTIKLSLSHSAAFFAVTLMCWSLMRAQDQRDRLAPWWLAGAGLGLAVILRFQLAVFAVVPAWVWLRGARDAGWGRTSVRAGMLVLGAGPLVFLQLFAWHVVYGTWLLSPYGAAGETFNWSDPQILPVLFSERHGLFYWHPLLLVGAAGFGWLAWRERGRGLLAAGLAAVLATVYVNASWWCWWFASSFGSRAFEGACLFFMGGLAWLWVRARPAWREALCAVFLAGAAWNFYIMALFYTMAIPRDPPVSWWEMLTSGGKGWEVVARWLQTAGMWRP